MFLSTWEGLAKTISWRWAGPWGKSLQKHRALHGARYRWRTWVVQSVATVVDFASHLRHLFNPAKLGAIASFLVCFVIVMTPPQLLFRPFTTSGSPSAARQHDFELTTAELLERAATQTRGLEPPREVSDPSLEQAESARVLTGEAVQVLEEKPQAETPIRNLFNRDHATERSLFSVEPAEPFVGIWGVDASACSPRLNRKGLLPAVIDGEGAWAGETFCTFARKKHTAEGWNVVASCSNAHDRWTANVRLIINGDQLTWTSERGSQSYLRCQPGLGVARAL